jgi:hypothetical protein
MSIDWLDKKRTRPAPLVVLLREYVQAPFLWSPIGREVSTQEYCCRFWHRLNAGAVGMTKIHL